jgi:hypothetical protein
VPREAGDIPCGGLPNQWLLHQVVYETPTLSNAIKGYIMHAYRGIIDVEYRLPQYALRPNANINRDIDIAYLMKEITEEEWGSKLEQAETRFERKKEIGLILQTLVHVGAEKMTMIQNTQVTQRVTVIERIAKELEELRTYINKSLLLKGTQMSIVVPQLGETFYFGWSTREEMKQQKKNKVENTIVYPTQQTGGDDTEPEEDTLENTEQEQNERIMLEIDGEIVEMTMQQAQEIMQT